MFLSLIYTILAHTACSLIKKWCTKERQFSYKPTYQGQWEVRPPGKMIMGSKILCERSMFTLDEK